MTQQDRGSNCRDCHHFSLVWHTILHERAASFSPLSLLLLYFLLTPTSEPVILSAAGAKDLLFCGRESRSFASLRMTSRASSLKKETKADEECESVRSARPPPTRRHQPQHAPPVALPGILAPPWSRQSRSE